MPLLFFNVVFLMVVLVLISNTTEMLRVRAAAHRATWLGPFKLCCFDDSGKSTSIALQYVSTPFYPLLQVNKTHSSNIYLPNC